MARVTHFEIQAQDPLRASKFYSEVFNWRVEKWDNPSLEYYLARTGYDEEEGINGAIVRRKSTSPEENSPVNSYVCIITVDNIDESIALIIKNGGKLVNPKASVSEIGWLAYCKDTEGNLFGIIQDDINAP